VDENVMKQPTIKTDRFGVEENATDRIHNQNRDSHENIKPVYEQLCQSYRAIDDFRGKLLGFLHLASGVGIFLVVREPGEGYHTGVFGFVVTLGFFVFEIDKTSRCTHLIALGDVLKDSYAF
jgi:hypothetical protein